MAIVTKHPGVYIEEVLSGVRPIEGAGTSTAVFIGKTGLTATVSEPIDETGLTATVSEPIDETGLAATVSEPIDETGLTATVSEPIGETGLTATVSEPIGETGLTATVSEPIGKTGLTATVSEPELIFKWADYVDKFGGLQDLGKSNHNEMGLAVYNFFLNGGGATYIVHTNDDTEYTKAFASLEKIRDLNIICLPGKTWPTHKDTIGLAIAHAEKMQNRMVIIDIDKGLTLNDPSDVDGHTGDSKKPGLQLTTSKFAAAYYPWLEIANPFYKPKEEEAEGEWEELPPTVKIAPSGFIAGMWSKIDGRRGVWKAPAGVETALLGVKGVVDYIDDDRQGILNPRGINCIRQLPGFGPVVWGARTLATKENPEWRYVPVRRTACMIEESIYNNIQWAVFEPNDHRLWSSLRVNIDAFMNGLWRAGAFQGEKASDAYFVRCNLGDTMEQSDIDAGKVIVEVGFAPLKPAEFVIVRIQQKVAQQ